MKKDLIYVVVILYGLFALTTQAKVASKTSPMFSQEITEHDLFQQPTPDIQKGKWSSQDPRLKAQSYSISEDISSEQKPNTNFLQHEASHATQRGHAPYPKKLEK